MGEPLRMAQALLMTREANSGSLAEALWTAFEELDALCNADAETVRFERFHLGGEPPPGIAGRLHAQHRIELAPEDYRRLEKALRGRYVSTIDQAALGEQVRALIEERTGSVGELLVLTDQELTPPPKWRYILWERTEPAWVVSTAAMDPEYWGIEDADRALKTKQRARAACMTAVGTSLGLKRCRNPQCFMFEHVDSVTRLDVMRAIGEEHPEFSGSESLGFVLPSGTDPRDAQRVAKAGALTIKGWPIP